MEYPNFVGPAYKLNNINDAGDQCINLYPETIESGTGKARAALTSTPGTTTFCTLPESPCRGLWAGDNRLFAVAGDTLYEISSGGVASSVGNISTDGQPVKFASNGNQLAVVSGSDLWIATGTSVVQPSYETISGACNTAGVDVTWVSGSKFSAAMVGTTITIGGSPYTVANFYGENYITLTASAGTLTAAAWSWSDTVDAVSIVYLDGYFIALKPNSNTIIISSLYDGLTWDPLDFANRNMTDRCVALEVANENLWIFGQKTTQVWYNSGDADFPFAPIQGATIDQGVWARFSIVNVGNTLIWLGGSELGQGVVWQAIGYQPKRISTYAIEQAIRGYATTNDAVAYGYQEDGHTFYVLNFPTADKTWVYDLTEGQWHERAYFSSSGGGTLRGQLQWYHASTFGNKHYVGSGTTAKVFEQARTIYTDDSRPIRRIRRAPHLSKEQQWMFYHSMQLDMQMGTQASAPTMYLSWSNDGGQTFGAEVAEVAGAPTDYTKRVIWRRLGRSRDRVFQVRTDDNGPHSWVAAYLKASEGTGA